MSNYARETIIVYARESIYYLGFKSYDTENKYDIMGFCLLVEYGGRLTVKGRCYTRKLSSSVNLRILLSDLMDYFG